MAKQKQVFTCNDKCLKLRFTLIEVNSEIRPQCVVFLEVLAHSS